MTGELTAAHIRRLNAAFDADHHNALMRNAISSFQVRKIALDRSVVVSIDPSMSHRLDTWKPTNQAKSGRCWLFAGLNLVRSQLAKSLGVEQFELSQSYLHYWDKFERSNYFLEAMTELAGQPLEDRTLAHLLATFLDDGGQWNMFSALVAKHGLMPKYAYPETESSGNTSEMNSVLRSALRRATRDLRAAKSAAARTRVKNSALELVHRILGIHLGTPPEKFVFQWQDKDKVFHREGWVTPQEFAARHVSTPLDDYVCLVDDPRNTYGRTYTVDYLGNVVGAPPVVYLNLPIADLKSYAMRQIVDGTPVWFGCDTGKQCDGDLGIWDARLFDFDGVYNTSFEMSKAERLLLGESMMTHAMLFTGVDVVDDVPRRWRVENSWGDERGDAGFFTMNDSWFDEHLFEIAVPRSLLTPAQSAALDREPVVLPAWDPMGALAH